MTYSIEFSHKVQELKKITEREISDQEIFDVLVFDETRMPPIEGPATEVQLAYLREWIWFVEELVDFLKETSDKRCEIISEFLGSFKYDTKQ